MYILRPGNRDGDILMVGFSEKSMRRVLGQNGQNLWAQANEK